MVTDSKLLGNPARPKSQSLLHKLPPNKQIYLEEYNWYLLEKMFLQQLNVQLSSD
jgi:hypothetical protein